jgi:hypothetical protein
MVFADTNASSRVELGTTLTNNDSASRNRLTTKGFYTEHFWFGITSISRRAAAFFLCHDLFFLLCRNRTNLQFCELLAMSLTFLIVLTTTHFKNAHFVVLAVRNYCDRYGRAGHQGRAYFDFRAVADRQNLFKHYLLAYVRSNLFYFNFFAGSNSILLAAGFYDRVHVDLFE